ncbi:hypothetical protein ABBQ38_000289 [Trebouxia sp. C0009 RCD-2024]
MSRQTAGTHRADTASTAGTWFQGKRLPLYGVVGATFLLGGYVFFFNTAKHPESNVSTSRKNQQLPGESHEKEAEDYQKNQPTRKLTQAAGKQEGDANIFPNKEASKKMSEAKDSK